MARFAFGGADLGDVRWKVGLIGAIGGAVIAGAATVAAAYLEIGLAARRTTDPPSSAAALPSITTAATALPEEPLTPTPLPPSEAPLTTPMKADNVRGSIPPAAPVETLSVRDGDVLTACANLETEVILQPPSRIVLRRTDGQGETELVRSAGTQTIFGACRASVVRLEPVLHRKGQNVAEISFRPM